MGVSPLLGSRLLVQAPPRRAQPQVVITTYAEELRVSGQVQDPRYDLYQSTFDLDERALPLGVRVMVHTALTVLT